MEFCGGPAQDGASWDHLGPYGEHLGQSWWLAWAVFEAIWGILDASESDSGLSWGRLGEAIGFPGAVWGHFWGVY